MLYDSLSCRRVDLNHRPLGYEIGKSYQHDTSAVFNCVLKS